MTGPYIKADPPFLRKHALYLAKGELERDGDVKKNFKNFNHFGLR